MTKKSFRLFGTTLILVGTPLRLHPGVVLPATFGYDGDFASTGYGQLLYGFADLMTIAVASGVLMLILSFTTLTNDSTK